MTGNNIVSLAYTIFSDETSETFLWPRKSRERITSSFPTGVKCHLLPKVKEQITEENTSHQVDLCVMTLTIPAGQHELNERTGKASITRHPLRP